jgi:hypothetical protein
MNAGCDLTSRMEPSRGDTVYRQRISVWVDAQ